MLEVAALSTGIAEPFVPVDLSGPVDEEMEHPRAVTSLRTEEGVATAGVSAQETRINTCLPRWICPTRPA